MSPTPNFRLQFLHWLTFLSILATSSSQELGNNSPFQLVPGIYAEELPNPIFYESYAPIILKYQLPNWNKSEVTFNNWYACITETAPFRYTCPVVYHMNKAILNLHIDFESIQPVQDFTPHDEFYSKLFANSDFCDSIQKHFSGIYIQDGELDKYIEALEQCHLSSSPTYMELFLPNYNFSIRHPFTRIENNFYNTFYKNINASLDLVASATLSNARATIQSILLSVYYAEKNRWTHALQDCKAGIIPHSVINYSKFNESLTKLSSTLPSVPSARPPLELAIPFDLISKYYGLPLTDCTFTNNSFVSRILIPVRNKGVTRPSSLKLLKLNIIPFLYKDKICQVQLDNEVEEKHLYDEDKKLAYKTKCLPNELCQISKTFMPNKLDPCVTALLTKDFHQFVKNCPFQCKDKPQTSESLITRVKSNKYVFVGRADGTLNDLGKQNPVQRDVRIAAVDEYYFGAIEVTLPCKSKLTIGNRILYSDRPCDENATYSEVLLAPWHFAEGKDDLNFDVGLLEHFVDNGGRQRPEHEVISAQITASQEQSSNTFIWIFFSFVSIILFSLQLFLFYQLNKLNGGSGRSIQNMFFNVRGRDPEPELRLINE